MQASKGAKQRDVDSDGKSKALLELETDCKNFAVSTLESKLLVCKEENTSHPIITKSEGSLLLQRKPDICSIPESEILGKVKDFLGIISEANERLEHNAKEDYGKHDIEVLNGSESEYIEMDLMLGVADLHTPEAVAAAESAIAGYQPAVWLPAGSGNTDDDDTDEESCEEKMSNAVGAESSSMKAIDRQSKKAQKIAELP